MCLIDIFSTSSKYICFHIFFLLFCLPGLVVCNSILFMTALLTIWCSFDVAGRSWVKLKKYQQSLRDQNTKKFQYKRSGGNSSRSWRHRYVVTKLLCLESSDTNNLIKNVNKNMYFLNFETRRPISKLK